MATTNLNIRTDKDIKNQADWIFSDRENGIPFALKLDVPNETTAAAIEEGRHIVVDSSVKGYTNIDDLTADLEV